jgi:hypothetical protein
MSMYVHMLSSALEAWDLKLGGEELLNHTVECRVRMLGTGTAHGASAYEALAAEIAYDRALIQLCAETGIDAGPTSFGQPDIERARLEACLTDRANIDLVGRSRSDVEDLRQSPPGSLTEPCRLT